jgi:hypothetical protein
LWGRYGWPFFAWNCCGAFLKEGRFLGILKKQSKGKMPKNRAEKNRYAVFSVPIRQILIYCCGWLVTDR